MNSITKDHKIDFADSGEWRWIHRRAFDVQNDTSLAAANVPQLIYK